MMNLSRTSLLAALRRALCAAVLVAPSLCLLSSCITEDVLPNTVQGNVDAMWRMLDERYCFFDYKRQVYGLDWDAVRVDYERRAQSVKTAYGLFELLDSMACELRDGHVNIIAPHNTARYGAWFDDYPANYSDTLQRIYLGKTHDYASAGGLAYRVLLPDSIGYLRCGSFASGFSKGNLHEALKALQDCKGLIVDVRSNGGGLLTSAERLASAFIAEPTLGGYVMHKTGTAHDAFSSPEPMTIKPFEGQRWTKPAVVLTNRRTYSAANSFVMFVKGLPSVRILGDRTGGGSGLPFTSELPIGWDVRFSACPMLNREMAHTELGIDPDVKVDITAADYARGIDTIIEEAKRLLGRSARE